MKNNRTADILATYTLLFKIVCRNRKLREAVSLILLFNITYNGTSQVNSQNKDKDRRKSKCRRYYLKTEFIQFLAALAIVHQNYFVENDEFQIASAAKNGINSVPQTIATTFAFSSVFFLLLWVNYIYTWELQWLRPGSQPPYQNRLHPPINDNNK